MVWKIVRVLFSKERHRLISIGVVLKLIPNEAKAMFAVGRDLGPPAYPNPNSVLPIVNQARWLVALTSSSLGSIIEICRDKHKIPGHGSNIETAILRHRLRVVLDLRKFLATYHDRRTLDLDDEVLATVPIEFKRSAK